MFLANVLNGILCLYRLVILCANKAAGGFPVCHCVETAGLPVSFFIYALSKASSHLTIALVVHLLVIYIFVRTASVYRLTY